MSMEKYQKQFETIAQQWITDLDQYSEEQFLRKPDEHHWSIGQVYVHLIQSAKNFHFKQIQLCIDRQGTEMKGGKKPPGILSYFLGFIPPVRVHVPPSPTYTPAQPSGKEQIAERLREVIREMNEIRSAVESASPNQKTVHPGFGYLNAQEWYRLIPMHYRHHRRQQKRLNTLLGIQ